MELVFLTRPNSIERIRDKYYIESREQKHRYTTWQLVGSSSAQITPKVCVGLLCPPGKRISKKSSVQLRVADFTIDLFDLVDGF